MSLSLLKTHWRNILVATYAAPEELLARFLPPGLELDRQHGSAHCSLVGFQFQGTSVLGIPSPFYRNFPEWNLRIYVRHGETRGVHFVREFVSQRWVAWAGQLLMNEPFATTPLSARVESDGTRKRVEYSLTRGGRTHRLMATASASTTTTTDADSLFTDLNCGYGRTRRGELLRFHVSRPEWKTHSLQSFECDVNWGQLYGNEWSMMTDQKPVSVSLVEGSEVRVSWPEVVRTVPGKVTAVQCSSA